MFDLRPNYGGGNEDNGDPLQKVPSTQCPRPCSRPPPTHASARDAWTLTGKSGSVSWGHCSFLLGPGAPGSACVLQESVAQGCVSSGGSMVGLRAASPRGLMPFPGLLHQSPCPCGRPLLTCTSTGNTQTLKGRSGSVSVESPGAHKVLFEPSEYLWCVWV